MKHAASDDHDAIVKAGNEFADQATPATEAIKNCPRRRSRFQHRVAAEGNGRHECANRLDEPNHGE